MIGVIAVIVSGITAWSIRMVETRIAGKMPGIPASCKRMFFSIAYVMPYITVVNAARRNGMFLCGWAVSIAEIVNIALTQDMTGMLIASKMTGYATIYLV